MLDAMYFFEKICEIPRPSGNCEKIADFLCDFARENGLYHERDRKNNVIIKKPAANGRENDSPVMLQGHTDMVCEKKSGCDFDFQKDKIKLIREGDILRADGTTLGGDDGVAVAVMLSILADKTADTPALECVFTSDEEIGMLGAAELDLSSCRAEFMINLDSDEEGVFTCGCAGGERVDFEIPVERETVLSPACTVEISGLCGGHSGTEINKGRKNAVKLLASILDGERIVSISKDGKDNAIPADCTAVILGDGKSIEKRFTEIEKTEAEPNMHLEISPMPQAEYDAMTPASCRRILTFVNDVPNGVRRMCDEPVGLVHTSDNLGIIKTEKNAVSGTLSVRSSEESRKKSLTDEIVQTVKTAEGKAFVHSGYPGWSYKKVSPLRETMKKVYAEMFGKEPKTDVIHAGLECGIISSKMKDSDIVSVGCNLWNIHTPDEKMSVSSFARLEKFIRRVLKEI